MLIVPVIILTHKLTTNGVSCSILQPPFTVTPSDGMSSDMASDSKLTVRSGPDSAPFDL